MDEILLVSVAWSVLLDTRGMGFDGC